MELLLLNEFMQIDLRSVFDITPPQVANQQSAGAAHSGNQAPHPRRDARPEQGLPVTIGDRSTNGTNRKPGDWKTIPYVLMP